MKRKIKEIEKPYLNRPSYHSIAYSLLEKHMNTKRTIPIKKAIKILLNGEGFLFGEGQTVEDFLKSMEKIGFINIGETIIKINEW